MNDKYSQVRFERLQSVARITLASPKTRNALTFPMIDEIKRAITVSAEDPRVRVLLIDGEGESFCSGDNLKDMGELPHDGDWLQIVQKTWYTTIISMLRSLPKPVVTLAHGYVLGAGLELFMAGDIKVVVNDSRLGIPFARLGIAAMNYQLPRAIGSTRAARMLFTGDLIDGRTAVNWGLATESVQNFDELTERSQYWVQKFEKLSTSSIGIMKETFYQSYEMSESEWVNWWAGQWLSHRARLDRLGEGDVDWKQAPAPEVISDH